MPDDFLDKLDRRDHVHCYPAGHRRAVKFTKIPEWRAARVIDQNVRLGTSRKQGRLAFRSTDVGSDRGHRRPCHALDFLCRLLKLSLPPAVDDKCGSSLGKCERAAFAKPLTRP